MIILSKRKPELCWTVTTTERKALRKPIFSCPTVMIRNFVFFATIQILVFFYNVLRVASCKNWLYQRFLSSGQKNFCKSTSSHRLRSVIKFSCGYPPSRVWAGKFQLKVTEREWQLPEITRIFPVSLLFYYCSTANTTVFSFLWFRKLLTLSCSLVNLRTVCVRGDTPPCKNDILLF